MSNYADPTATHRFELGPCRCPVEPTAHPNGDWAVVVDRFGYGDEATIHATAQQRGTAAGYMVTILLGVREWSYVLPDGTPRPINALEIARLDKTSVLGRSVGTGKKERVVQVGLMHAFEHAFDEDPLPNESGAPSPDGPLESASPTPTTGTPPAPTST